MKTIALARWLADEYGEQIEAAAGGRVRLLPLRGEEGEADLDDVEIAVYGLYEGPLSFRELADRMPNLRWIHSTGAGIESFATPRARGARRDRDEQLRRLRARDGRVRPRSGWSRSRATCGA